MTSKDVVIEPMTMAHYDDVIALWRAAPGVGLSPSDAADPLDPYLRRKPGLPTTSSGSADCCCAP